MHLLLTVFVEPEHATTDAARDARVWELMKPYWSSFGVPPYERDCTQSVHDEACCNGTLRLWATANPSPTWGDYVLVGSGESCWENAKPELTSFALLGPDEG